MKTKNTVYYLVILNFWGLSCISSPGYKYNITEPPLFVPNAQHKDEYDWFTLHVRNDCKTALEVRIAMLDYFVLDPRKRYWYRTLKFTEGGRQQSITLPADESLQMSAAVLFPEDWLFSSGSLRVRKLYYSKDSEPELIIDCSGPDDVQLQYIGPDGKTYPNDEPREREEYRIAPIGP